ncbi:Replication regulatory protein RepB [compost metagenome]
MSQTDTYSETDKKKLALDTRRKQVAEAQQRKREQEREEGLKHINIAISGTSKLIFLNLCDVSGLTQREVMEKIITQAAREDWAKKPEASA